MKNMQTFYRWLTAGARQEDMYREQLAVLSQTELTRIVSAANFLGWKFWGSTSGPDTK